MKSWTLDDDIKSDPNLAAAIEALRPSLEKSLTPRFAAETDATWTLVPGGVGLWIADESVPDGVHGVLRADELAPGPKADHQLRQIASELRMAGVRAIVEGIWAELETVNG